MSEEDPRLKAARQLVNNKQFDDALQLLTPLMESLGESNNGEMNLEMAEAHIAYATALLAKEEDNPSDDLLANVDRTADQIAAKVESGDAAKSEDSTAHDAEVAAAVAADAGSDHEEGEGEEYEEEEEDVDDVQIAWEILEVTRLFLEKEPKDRKINLLLASVHMLLGDVSRLNGNFLEAITEYTQAATIREAACDKGDRLIADAHYSIAIAHIYNCQEKDDQYQIGQKQSAEKHYTIARDNLRAWNPSSSSDDSEAHDVSELIDELSETIESLRQEIADLESGKKEEGPTTTIGFGSSSSSAVDTSAKRAANSSSVNTLQPKKKRATE